jgi:hypothetical protein
MVSIILTGPAVLLRALILGLSPNGGHTLLHSQSGKSNKECLLAGTQYNYQVKNTIRHI